MKSSKHKNNFMNEKGIDAFGVKLIAGRNFSADEIINSATRK